MGPDPAPLRAPVDLVERLFSTATACRRFGEPVPIGSHMRQTASLAEAGGAAPSLVVAALLHDVGYLLASDLTDELRVEVEHAEVGAVWLERWFPPSVSEPVRLHVDAKRYLAFTESDYLASLSNGSTHTLALQGGVMTADEADRFERREYFDSAVELRRWDERGKDTDVLPPSIEHYRRFIWSVGC